MRRTLTDVLPWHVAAAELCSRNVALQAECRTLLAEVHSLRTYMSQAHAQGSCQCQHVNGYLAREAEGGGIPAILYGAGKTLERDYTHPPKWGSEDDALAGAIELRALERITRGDPLDALPEADQSGGLSSGSRANKGLSSSRNNNHLTSSDDTHQAAVGRTSSRRTSSRDLDVDELKPVVGRAKGAIPIRNGNQHSGAVSTTASGAAPPTAAGTPKRPGMATRGSSSIAVTVVAAASDLHRGNGSDNDDDDDEDIDDEEESEAEHIALKSRRARAIPLRKVA